MKKYAFEPIGFFYTDTAEPPRHWSVSEEKGRIVLEKKYKEGITDYSPGDKIMVIFVFHKNPEFSTRNLRTKPPHKNEEKGVFSICSPVRPNPLGISVLQITKVENNIIYVQNIDMLNETPILDIKPFITDGK